jgi:uncharacterized damage-inducible protein DinB
VLTQPEAWLLGHIDGHSDALMPVAFALMQARNELTALARDTSAEEIRVAPGGAASVGFHLAHIAGSLDRLFTYARHESLDPTQLEYLRREAEFAVQHAKDDLFEATMARIDVCLTTLREIPDDVLPEPRPVGRRELPSTVRGLLFHAAEHTTMHVGQIRTTLRVIRGLGLSSDDAR